VTSAYVLAERRQNKHYCNNMIITLNHTIELITVRCSGNSPQDLTDMKYATLCT